MIPSPRDLYTTDIRHEEPSCRVDVHLGLQSAPPISCGDPSVSTQGEQPTEPVDVNCTALLCQNVEMSVTSLKTGVWKLASPCMLAAGSMGLTRCHTSSTVCRTSVA
eukprot:643131-Rhodomonas_salina.2